MENISTIKKRKLKRCSRRRDEGHGVFICGIRLRTPRARFSERWQISDKLEFLGFVFAHSIATCLFRCCCCCCFGCGFSRCLVRVWRDVRFRNQPTVLLPHRYLTD